MYINEKLNKFKREIYGKKVAVIGMGISNIPLIDYLMNLGTDITVFDKRTEDKLDKIKYDEFLSKGVKFSLGDDNLGGLVGFDYIFRSPSVRPDIPEIEAEVQRGAILTSEIEMLMELCPGKVIGITGSDGKTTTTTLTYLIMKEEGYNCYLGGNIGIPLFDQIDLMKPEDYIILELSSFQLFTFKKSPQIAVITNISPNHLDIHKDYQEYIDAKKNIFKYQTQDDLTVLNHNNEITRGLEGEVNGRLRLFSSEANIDNGVFFDEKSIKIIENGDIREVVNNSEIRLIGNHNLENCCTAIAAVKDLVSVESIKSVLTTFNGVEHRNELVKVVDGVVWRNDSIGSSPTRTIAGLKSFKEKVILIAGGYDKHLDYTELGTYIVNHARALILLGQTSAKIKEATLKALLESNINVDDYPIFETSSLEEAVSKAREISHEGDTVFFSPASASFDMFKNFEERGNKFKEIVMKM